MKKIAGKVTDIDFISRKSTLPKCPISRLVHSADEYNLHGAKRLFTIPNVLSASCPSVKQDGENKWFLHTDCFTLNSIVNRKKCSPTLRYLMKHIFKFLSIKFSPQNSAFSFSNRFIFQLFVIVFTRVGPFPERAEDICRRLRKLTSNINLF